MFRGKGTDGRKGRTEGTDGRDGRKGQTEGTDSWKGLKMDIVKKEIKEALLGDLVSMDRRLVVSGLQRVKYRNGLRDGFGNVLIMGVMCSRRWYMTKKSAKQIRELAVKAMQDMGRMMLLGSLPEAEAVYCTYLLNHPAVLTFTQGRDGIIEVAAYSARDLSGMLATYRTLNRFQKAMRDVLERMSEEGEAKRQNALREQGREDKQRDKQEKRDKKQAKKLARKQERERKRQNGPLAMLWKNTVGVNLLKQGKTQQEQVGKTETGNAAAPAEQAKTGNTAAPAEQTVTGFAAAPAEQTVTGSAAAPAEQTVTGSAAAPVEQTAADFAAAQAAATEARLMAEAAEARLAAAEARLAAEQAQAQLAEMQAKLAAAQQTQSTSNTGTSGISDSTGNSNTGTSGSNTGNRKKNRKKKK